MSEADQSISPQPAPLSPSYDPNLVQQFLDNQTVELHLRQQEQGNRKKELENGHEYALKLLEAQLADRQREREMLKSNISFSGSLLLVITLALIGALCYALYLNKDQFVKDFLQAVILLLSGGVGDYGLRALKGSKDNKPD
jgi:hypothetical protein